MVQNNIFFCFRHIDSSIIRKQPQPCLQQRALATEEKNIMNSGNLKFKTLRYFLLLQTCKITCSFLLLGCKSSKLNLFLLPNTPSGQLGTQLDRCIVGGVNVPFSFIDCTFVILVLV